MDIQGKVVLVTGGANRVGREISLYMASLGMTVAFTYSSSVKEASKTLADIQERGRPAMAMACDQTIPHQVENAVAETYRAFGRLDVLINNAAIMQEMPFLAISPDDWDRTLDINLKGPFLFTQAVARRMLEQSGGAIINIADDPRPWPFGVHHSVSKAGVQMLTRATALALAPTIRVNAIAPGPIMQPVTWEKEDYERLEQSTPLKKLGSPQDVCLAIRYLLEADWVTGQVLVVDGGRSI